MGCSSPISVCFQQNGSWFEVLLILPWWHPSHHSILAMPWEPKLSSRCDVGGGMCDHHVEVQDTGSSWLYVRFIALLRGHTNPRIGVDNPGYYLPYS